MRMEMRQILLRHLDRHVSELNELRRLVSRPARGWLRAVREALGLSQNAVASKLSLTRGAWTKMENTEAREGISLATLRRAADALDCELVYFLVPRELVAETFTDLAKANDPAMGHLAATEHSMALEGQAVGDLAAKEQPSR
ncbi:MAG: transcriptional regulator [Verrucomicrobia bacterium]|nr:MAG: transcriptional regulator [Verrucomicrobiota bacterium]